MRIIEVRKIWDDGGHNAFTDICRWGGYYWVSFRHSLNHSCDVAAGKIFILRSRDGKVWEKASEMAQEGADLRDPKFAVRDDRLVLSAMHIKMGVRPLEIGPLARYRTEDGSRWQRLEDDPSMCFFLWRPFKTADGFYASSYVEWTDADGKMQGRSNLMFSKDGLAWEKVSRIASEGNPNETSLDIAPDGTMLALVRRDGPDGTPLVCTAKPPYTDWECRRTDRWLQGPMMKRVGDRLLVAGRCQADDELRTGLFWLEGTSLQYISALPSGKDTSYAGMVQRGPGSALLSYYSGHESESGSYAEGDKAQRTAIYVATLKL